MAQTQTQTRTKPRWSPRQRARLALWVVALLVVGVVVGLPVWVTLSNDAGARAVAEELRDAGPPAQSEILDTAALASRFAGAGNGIEYFGAILIRSDLSLPKLQEHYAGRAQVLRTDDVSRESYPRGTAEIFPESGGPDRFVVFDIGEATSPFLMQYDIRGH